MFCSRLAVVARRVGSGRVGRVVFGEGKLGSDADADLAARRFKKRLADYRSGHRATPEAWRQPGTCLAEVLAAVAGRGGWRIHEDDHVLYEAALQRIKDSKGSAKPLNRREAFRAVWRERKLGSDADADQAEQRFARRLSEYRVGHYSTPEAWRQPGTCLAEALAAPAGRGGRAARGRGQRR
jgi:hypothetical protein